MHHVVGLVAPTTNWQWWCVRDYRSAKRNDHKSVRRQFKTLWS